ncbi:hypothetical protein [Rhodococcus qingshengii]|uniref:hypothetical protein n=1 Tax=Rhodococcus qingshengii TaxID=334542 RepID=UPI0028DD058C|nr:hypothetical protein [uncultured Rhodococcus sp.]
MRVEVGRVDACRAVPFDKRIGELRLYYYGAEIHGLLVRAKALLNIRGDRQGRKVSSGSPTEANIVDDNGAPEIAIRMVKINANHNGAEHSVFSQMISAPMIAFGMSLARE